MSSLTLDEKSILERLEMFLPCSKSYLIERHRVKMAELTRGISAIKEGLVHMSNVLEVPGIVGRHEAELAGLRQARRDTPSPTLSRGLL